MKKILLSFFALCFALSAQAHIDVDYNDGIYHALLSGDKIKKRIQFVS